MDLDRKWIVEWAEKYDVDNKTEKQKENTILEKIRAIGNTPDVPHERNLGADCRLESTSG